MTLKIVFDESHEEGISLRTCLKLNNILKKHSIIVFRLLIGPITPEKIEDVDVLFIGAPRISFSDEEISTIVDFISNGGFLVLVCDSARNQSLTINNLAKYFGIRFDFNHIRDPKKHWKNAIYFPQISIFNKGIISKNINKIYYSGSTLTLLSEDCYPLAFTSNTAIPPNSPIIAISCQGRCISIGGSTLFYDEEFGIMAGQNSLFISNLFRYLEIAKKDPSKLITLRTQLIPQNNQKKQISLKKAVEILNKIIKKIFNDYSKIYDTIDDYLNTTIDMIRNNKIIEAKSNLKQKYTEIQNEILSRQLYLFDIIEKLQSEVNNFQAFDKIKNEKLNEFYVKESEVNEHLDRIYGRLEYYTKNPEAIP
ncbi:MAG: hypothetical protein ACTSRP_16540 [Candidatus Helarchaeota archaeon]